MIDVIIPAFRGFAQTRRCLESVLAAAVRAPHEVVVIDDASPEPALSDWLRKLAGAGRITLLAHVRNAGFVASVNEGMRLHPDRDVVLLNSDTEVAGDWLDRLAACAAREPHAGTVTPFSNNATIASYPNFAQSNPMPEGLTPHELDAIFARANPAGVADLPTAVGFCMFINRRCLDEIGELDAAAFGHGYGEEVDFCMRASRRGWRHLLAADTFVYHEGEVSFGAGGAAIRERAQRIVDERYPEFQPRLREFLARDPTAPFRRAADLERLGSEIREVVPPAGDLEALPVSPAGTGDIALRARTEELEAALFEARARADALESSTFWRLTAPLRFVANALKLALRAITSRARR